MSRINDALRFLLADAADRVKLTRAAVAGTECPPFLDDDVMTTMHALGLIELRVVDAKTAPVGAMLATDGHGTCAIVEVTPLGRAKVLCPEGE